MANFNTHLSVATGISALSAAALLSADLIDFTSALWLWFLGTIGGLLPDIDADNSTSLDTLFNLFATSTVLLVVRYMTADAFIPISYLELILLPPLMYVMLRYLIRPVFEKITVHRGSCHSLLFLSFIALLTTQVTWRLLPATEAQSAIIAWLSGGFLFMGA